MKKISENRSLVLTEENEGKFNFNFPIQIKWCVCLRKLEVLTQFGLAPSNVRINSSMTNSSIAVVVQMTRVGTTFNPTLVELVFKRKLIHFQW